MFERFEFTVKLWQIALVVLLGILLFYTYHLGKSHFVIDYKEVKHACLQVERRVDIQEFQLFNYMPEEIRFVCEK